MKTGVFIFLIVAGLAVWALRIRHRALTKPVPAQTAPPPLANWRETLRREADKQRPWEGRN